MNSVPWSSRRAAFGAVHPSRGRAARRRREAGAAVVVVAVARRWIAVVAALLAAGNAFGQACLHDDADAARLPWGEATCVVGVASGERTVRTYDVAISAADRVHRLTAAAPAGGALELCLDLPGGAHCRRGEAQVSLPDLVLPAGIHTVRFTGRWAAGGAYRLDLEDVGPVREGHEREPNDGPASATVVGATREVYGRLEGREQDYFRIVPDGDAGYWRVTVSGPGVTRLRFHDAAGNVLQERRAIDGATARLDNLLLLPGPHWFSLDGEDADYRLVFTPLSPEAGGGARWEREPNDDARRAQLLRPGEPMFGTLPDESDVDVVRIYLGEDAHLRVTVTPASDGAVRLVTDGPLRGTFRGAIGEDVVVSGWFLAGDHMVRIEAETPSEGAYRVLLEHLDPFDLPDDLEPNDGPHQARPLPGDLVVHGSVGTHGDADWFLIPPLESATRVTVSLEGVGVRLGAIRDSAGRSTVARFVRGSDPAVVHADLPAGGPYPFEIAGAGTYRVALDVASGTPSATPRPEPAPLDVHVTGPSTVAAHHHLGQRLPLEVEVRNRGGDPVDVSLAAHVSDHGWIASALPQGLRIGAGEALRVPLQLQVLPYARDDHPVRITVAAMLHSGAVATGAIDVGATCAAAPIDPHRAWSIPEAWLGGLDVAWTGLGATPAGRGRELQLYDGLTPPSGGWAADLGGATVVRLAGAAPSRVIGVLLHPLSAGSTDARAAEFRVSASIDGEVFTEVLRDRLRAVAIEQAFAFDEPVIAQYLRLELLSRQDGLPRGPVHLGAFKAIADPTSMPAGARVDLARREVGGHVAGASPYLASYELTSASARAASARLAAGASGVWWVLGFHHGRAALLDSLAWLPHATADPGRQIAEVRVSRSVDGPLGPWTAVGTWRPQETSTWAFDEPVWARYLRFEADGFEARATVEFPDRIEVFEHPAGPEYRSILGEWGHYGRDAALEWHLGATVGIGPTVAASLGANGSRDDAAPLVPGDTVTRRVAVGEAEAWFSFDVPADQDYVRLALSGEPSLDVRYELHAATGSDPALEVVSGPAGVVLQGFVPPGRYLLRVWEPPRSVVFAWDDSGSMGPYVDATYQAVFGFVEALRPGQEEVQLLAFSRPPQFVLDGWTAERDEALAGLLRYDRRHGSSDAEANLAFVVEQLAERDGARVVLLITDAESGPGAATVEPLWRALETVRPRVFTFETSSGGSDHTQDRMQTWADAGGGLYEASRAMGDLDVAFARVGCLLRRPRTVHVTLQLEARPAPGPGALVVRPSHSDATSDHPTTVHVVFDASGSMGKLLPDGRTTRLDAARSALGDLVAGLADDAVWFGLRAYGHVRAGSCDTRLELRPAPLDSAVARRAIAGIEPKLLSGTPLAASIEAVAQDLASVRGPSIVVVVTDGEETCGGDPERAIRALREAGVDVRLSIVGFDLDADDPIAARDRFATWATLGGGRYLEASDGAALREAVVASLEPLERRYEVVDQAGLVVATGTVGGEPVMLPGGAYVVRPEGTDGAPPVPVVVRPDAVTEVVLESR